MSDEYCRQTLFFMASDREQPRLPPVSDHAQRASAPWPCGSEQEPQLRPSTTVCCIPHVLSAECHSSPCSSPSPKRSTPLHALIYLSAIVLPDRLCPDLWLELHVLILPGAGCRFSEIKIPGSPEMHDAASHNCVG